MKNISLMKKLLATALAAICVAGTFQFGGIEAKAAPTINIGSTGSAANGDVKSYVFTADSSAEKTNRRPSGSYTAHSPNMVTLVDYKNLINTAYSANGKVVINRFDVDGNLKNQISLTKQLSLFGSITCDNSGNYYVVTGQDDEDSANIVVINIAKYDYNGNLIGKCDVKSLDTSVYVDQQDDYHWGTQYPFDAGNCQIAYNNGFVCVNYARKMFSGHQSNNVIYVNASTMKRESGSTYLLPYMSHSFDQRVIGTSDGGFLLAGQGDAYYRGFGIDKVNPSNGFRFTSGYPFYFREGSSRSYGYNETFAQLGGITETSKSYIFCGSSEKTLSFDRAPGTTDYTHNEARNLFVQYIKKDFTGGRKMGTSNYYVQGETRVATGTYEGRSSDQEIRLTESKDTYVNYGVIWLTDYDANHYAANPKIVTDANDNVIIMWEERTYSTYQYGDNESVVAFYTVLNAEGKVVTPVKKMDGVRLCADADPVCLNGAVYWATNDEKGARLNVLKYTDNKGEAPDPNEDITDADKEVVDAFVTRLYRDCLGREPEAAGLSGWSEQLCNRKIDGATIGAGFVFSDEYMNKGTTKTEYIKMLYKVFMGREADEAGLTYWKNQMSAGKTREDVFKGFVDSKEYTEICEASGIKKGTYTVKGIADPKVKTGIVTSDIRNYVERIYVKALNRGSDPEGINYWSQQIANEEWDPIAVAEYFIISPEFESKNLNDTEYVKVLYRTFMGREYDQDGLNYWLNRLKNGDSRQTVLEAFAGCPEFQKIIKSFGL